jgi:hypothetical protein
MPVWWSWFYWLNPLSYMIYGVITRCGDITVGLSLDLHLVAASSHMCHMHAHLAILRTAGSCCLSNSIWYTEWATEQCAAEGAPAAYK